jgi:6-phosphogluconolactonase
VADEALGGAQLVVLDDPEAVAQEAARRTIDALAVAIAQHGAGHVALTGGSSAVPFYRALTTPDAIAALNWERVHLWWGDERFVPIDHPESNAGMAYRMLLALEQGEAEPGPVGLPIDPHNVHPIEVEETLSDSEPIELAAQRYIDEMQRWLPAARGALPRFDVILTGVGPDGHVMSVFPGSRALAHDAPAAIAVPAPEHVEPHLPRVTLSAPVLHVAGLVLVMAPGAGKRGILDVLLGPEHDEQRWPAQAALLPNAVWLLDRAAAGNRQPSG